MDNSSTWVVHGPSDSVAFQSHEAGFDVFLGNFRGNYPRKTTKWRKEDNYWDYTIDDYSRYDIKAFLAKIHEIKIQELKQIYY